MQLSLHEDLEGLLARSTQPVAAKPPAGWEPVVEQSAEEVRATTVARPARAEDPADADLLEEIGLDPALWVVERVRKSKWQGFDGEWKEAFKVSAVRRDRVAGVDTAELERLREQVSILPETPPLRRPQYSDSTFVVTLADWQMGKGERGGSEATVERIQTAIDAAASRLEELLLLSRGPERIALIGLGDLVEGCTGFYNMQEFQTDLTRREQVNVVRRLLLRAVRRLAEYGLPLTVATVAGNHGENRKKGKAFTTFGDNDDVAVFEQVADIVAESPAAFGDPAFAIPGDDLSLALDLSGVRVAIVHGHQFGGGATPGAKALSWWQKQALGNQPAGGAQILLSGHFHHLDMNGWGTRTHFQAPSLDGGSQWFRELAGVDSAPGLLTLLVGEGCGPLGWSDLQIV